MFRLCVVADVGLSAFIDASHFVQKSVEPSRLLEEEGDLDLSADVSQAGRELT